MNKKSATILIATLIMVFLGYIVFDVAFRKELSTSVNVANDSLPAADMWKPTMIFEPGLGKLTSVAAGGNSQIILGGESFIACYDSAFRQLWEFRDSIRINSLSFCNDTIYAATDEIIRLLSNRGELIGEWGPFEDNAIITSVSAGSNIIVFADAGNKIIIVLDKKGSLLTITSPGSKEFIIPSPYFDVAVGGDNKIYVANTGHRRIETRSYDGRLLRYFGEAGSAPDAFCGCCNPAHFAIFGEGFVTSEKGINRIKILNKNGEFVEFVSSVNDFFASIPLDIAVSHEKTIYAANPQDSKLYIFKRK